MSNLFYGIITSILFLGLLTLGINNVRLNKEILTFNPINLLKAIVSTTVAVVPHLIVGWLIGDFIIKIFKFD